VPTSKRMTQAQIVEHLISTTSLNREQVTALFNELASLARAEILKGNEFVLPGFGKLVLAQRQAREGRNPATGQPISIPAKQSLKLRLAKSMKGMALGGGNTTKSDI